MMEFICLLTLSISLYDYCASSSPSQLMTRSLTADYPLISGLNFVGVGFDITRLETRQWLLELDDTNNISSWTDPLNQSLTYQVPNEFDVVGVTVSSEIPTTNIISDVYEFVMHTLYHVRQDPDVYLGFLSSTRDSQSMFVHQQFYQFEKYLASTKRTIPWYSLNLILDPLPKLNNGVMQALAVLPSSFDETNQTHINLFQQFFEAYGTHAVVNSTMGGLVWAQDWFDSCLLETHNITWIHEQVKKRDVWSVFQSLNVTEETETMISEEFNKHSEFLVKIIGGTESYPISQLPEWIATLKENPRPMSYDLIPIYELLSPTNEKRESLANATQYFRIQADLLERAYINELKATAKASESQCQKSLEKRSLTSAKVASGDSTNNDVFTLAKEARKQLCPFVGIEGMECFDLDNRTSSGRFYDEGNKKLPLGIGISVDRTNGRFLVPSLNLTYSSDGGRLWTDGHSGQMFDLFNEAILGSPNRDTAAYDQLRVRVFYNILQLESAWQKTFADGSVRGGVLAKPPNFNEIFNTYFHNDYALALSQRAFGLYTLRVNPSTVQLNKFARYALSQLPSSYNVEDYDDFITAWGTHIITKSLIGGMIEEQATVKRCMVRAGSATTSRCIPFSDRTKLDSDCTQYASEYRILQKRRLGGNIDIVDENAWKKTLATGPALLQILEMVPWYDFVSDASIKENLRTAINRRLKAADTAREQTLNTINAVQSPWIWCGIDIVVL